MLGVNFRPWHIPDNPQKYISQVFSGDAVYVKDFRLFHDMETSKLFKTAAILADIFHTFDLCGYILRIIDKREGTDAEEKFGKWFTNQ